MNQRNHSLDTLRTLAAVLVVLIHISDPEISAAARTSVFGCNFMVANAIDSFCRIAVPLFVLISGGFLLGRQESAGTFYRKRASRILIPLIAWTVICLVFRLLGTYISHGTWEFEPLLLSLADGKPFYHLWYLYMLVGLYAVAPVLNMLVGKLSRKMLWIIALTCLGLGVLNELNDFIRHYRHTFFAFWFIDYIGYFLLGYLVGSSPRRIPVPLLAAGYLLSCAAIALLTWFTLSEFRGAYFYLYLSPFVIVAGLCAYKIFCQAGLGPNLFSRLAPYSLGIYLIHPLILMVVSHLKSIPVESALLKIPILFAICFAGSLLGTYLLSKVKYLDRIV